MSENDGKDRRKNEQEHENAPIAINVDELLVSDAADRLDHVPDLHLRSRDGKIECWDGLRHIN